MIHSWFRACAPALLLFSWLYFAGGCAAEVFPATAPQDSLTAAPQMVRMDITPPLAVAHVGDTVIFRAHGFDAANQLIPFLAVWRAQGGGLIDQSGRFHATETGRYTIAVRDRQGRFSATATVVVEPASNQGISGLHVEPGLVRLRPGQQVRFTALATSRNGETLTLTPGWQATGGVIDGDGVFRAGNHPGYYRITATDPDSNLRAIAVVQVVHP